MGSKNNSSPSFVLLILGASFGAKLHTSHIENASKATTMFFLEGFIKIIPAKVLQGFEVDYDFAQELGKCFD
jgi:hypothetical protein